MWPHPYPAIRLRPTHALYNQLVFPEVTLQHLDERHLAIVEGAIRCRRNVSITSPLL